MARITNWVKHIRESKGITVQDLADALVVARQQIYRVEKDETQLNVDRLRIHRVIDGYHRECACWIAIERGRVFAVAGSVSMKGLSTK